jgi:hypothetical protein
MLCPMYTDGAAPLEMEERTRPLDLDFNHDSHRSNDSNSYGEAIHMSDLEHQGGYHPLHHERRGSSIFERNEAFPPNLVTNSYVTSNKCKPVRAMGTLVD